MRFPQILSLFVFSLTYLACTAPSTIATGTEDQCAESSLTRQLLVPRGWDGRGQSSSSGGPSNRYSGRVHMCGDPGIVSLAWNGRVKKAIRYGKDLAVWVVPGTILPGGMIIKQVIVKSQGDMTLLRNESRKDIKKDVWYIIQYYMGVPASKTNLPDNLLAIIQQETLSYYRSNHRIVPPPRMAVDPDIYVYAKNPLDIKYRLGQDVEGWYGDIVGWAMADRVEPRLPDAENLD